MSRSMCVAIVISVLAHLALLAGWRGARPAEDAMRPVNAALVAALVVPQGREIASDRDGRRDTAARLSVPLPIDRRKLRESPRVLRVPDASPATASRPALAEMQRAKTLVTAPAEARPDSDRDASGQEANGDRGGEATPVAGAPVHTGRAAPAAPVASAASARRVSASDLGAYRLDIAQAAKQFKRYPPAARARGVTGTTEILVRSQGLPGVVVVGGASASVGQSSGNSVLDRAALLMIEQALAVVALPEALRGRPFSLSLPIEFQIDE